MSDYIPGDVMTDILASVPAEDLVRFTLVCKKWYALIKSPTFISLHLKLSLDDQNRHNPLLSYKHKNDPSQDHYSLLVDDDCTLHDYKRFTIPLPLSEIWYKIIGSCNGLICLDSWGNKNTIFIWNPMINKAIHVPGLHVSQRGSIYVLGFGFDSVNNDYKIVRLSYPDPDVRSRKKTSCGVQVYSLSEGFWRKVSDETPPYSIVSASHQAYIHGAVHWIAPRKRADMDNWEYVIAIFDMKDEIFREMPVPVQCNFTFVVENTIHLQVYQESISLFHQYFTLSNDAFCTVWVMREYGVPQSWAKLFQVDLLASVLADPLGLRLNGEVLFPSWDADGELFSYDSEKNVATDLKYPIYGADPRSLFYFGTYTHSLVLLDKGEEFHDVVTKEIGLEEESDKEEDEEKVNSS